jgi:hypothetical protein
MEVTHLYMRLLAEAGLQPRLVREPGPDAPGVIAFRPPGEVRTFALFPDERDPRYARVTTGMGFERGEAPDPAALLRLANEANRAFRFVRTVVEGRRGVEFVYEGVLEAAGRLAGLLAVAVPALAAAADHLFERLYLDGRAEA